jgi:hypothetical protein
VARLPRIKTYRPRLSSRGRWGGLGWFVIPQWNITIGAAAKVGTCTLKDFMQGNSIECDYVPHHKVTNNVHFIVRDPVSRFESLWRNKCRDGHGGTYNEKTQYPIWRKLHHATPDELMDYIEAGNTDAHWMHQTKVLGGLDAKLIPLTMLDFWWKQSGLGDLLPYRANTTVKDDTVFSDELIQRVLTFYAEDVILHNKAERDFCWDTLLKLKPQLKQ